MRSVPSAARSLLVGLTGGIASGKSVVADMLEELGARSIDFDLLARRVVATGEPAWREIVGHFGSEVLAADRSIDRQRLGEIVFADPGERVVLERLTHPRIRDEFIRDVRAIEDSEPGAIIVAVVPLLVENAMQSMFDHVVVVFAPVGVQLDRLMRRDGLSSDAAQSRLAAQLPIEDKLSIADTVIDNSGPLERTRQQVEELWERLCLLRNTSRADRTLLEDEATP